MAENEERWSAPLWELMDEEVATLAYVRGFVEEMTFFGRSGAEGLIGQADALFRSAPLRSLRLFAVGGHDLMREMPWETRTKLVVDRLRPADLEEVLRLPQMERVRVLDLSGTTLRTPDGLEVIVSNLIGDEQATLMAEAPSLKGLKSLLLRDNVISDRGALALAESPSLTGLTTLDLSHNSLSEAMKEELRRRLGERVLLD